MVANCANTLSAHQPTGKNLTMCESHRGAFLAPAVTPPSRPKRLQLRFLLLASCSCLVLAIAATSASAQPTNAATQSSAPKVSEGVLTGTVRNQTDGTPITGATVQISGPKEVAVTTGGDGTFKFPALPPGAYKLTVKFGGQRIERDIAVESGKPATADIRIAVAGPASAVSAAEEVTILGQRAQIDLARQAQEQAPNLINIQPLEEIQKLPDVSLAEAVRRVPGVSAETDEGESRYINIRGCDAELNSTTYDGVQLLPTNNASPTAAYRAMALDSLPIGFIGSVKVTKSNTPDMDPEALCGTIDITSRTAPQGSKPFIFGDFGSGWEPSRNTPVDNFSITGGGTKGPLSAVITVSEHENWRGIDDVEPAYFNKASEPYYSISDIQQRDYELHRVRHGESVDLGLQPDKDNQWYLRAFDAGYTEWYQRQFLEIQPDGNATVLPNGQIQDTLTGSAGQAPIQKELREERETSTERLVMAGGKHTVLSDATFDYHAAYVSGDWNKPYDWNSAFQYNNPNTGTPTGTITYGLNGEGHTPLYSITGAPGYLDPHNYTLTGFNNSKAHNYDNMVTLASNLKVPLHWSFWQKYAGLDAEDESVKFGSQTTFRHKVLSAQPYTYGNLPALSLAQASAGGNETYYGGQYQNGVDIIPGYLQNLLGYTAPQMPADTISGLQQFLNAHENIYSTYLQYEATFGRLGILAGTRYEKTYDWGDAYQAGKTAGGNFFAFGVTNRHTYSNFFPSIQGRYELAPKLLLRATWSSTIARPGFNQSNPSFTIDLGSGTAAVGNPNLKPATSNNFDVSLERYLPGGAIMSIDGFDKEISNYIVPISAGGTVTIVGNCPGCVGGQNLTINTFKNVSSSYARGFEANLWGHFPGLPGIWNGLGAGVNYTYVYSSIETRPGDFTQLPESSKHTANASLFYDRQGLHLDAAVYYVSRDIFTFGSDATSDVWNAARLSMDLGASYQFQDHWVAYADAKNILDTATTYYLGNEHRPIQREFYGPTFLAGFRFNY